jgi:hypothetical protein
MNENLFDFVSSFITVSITLFILDYAHEFESVNAVTDGFLSRLNIIGLCFLFIIFTIALIFLLLYLYKTGVYSFFGCIFGAILTEIVLHFPH